MKGGTTIMLENVIEFDEELEEIEDFGDEIDRVYDAYKDAMLELDEVE